MVGVKCHSDIRLILKIDWHVKTEVNYIIYQGAKFKVFGIIFLPRNIRLATYQKNPNESNFCE